MNVSFSLFNEFPDLKTGVNINLLSDFSISKSNENFFEYEDAFVIHLTGEPGAILYYHFLIDGIAEFEYLKSIYKDLKLIFLIDSQDFYKKACSQSRFIEDIINIYKKNNIADIIFLENSSIIVKKLFWISKAYNKLIDNSNFGIVETNNINDWMLVPSEKIRFIKMYLVQDKFKKYLEVNKKSPKKIYISRKIANKRIEQDLLDIIDNKLLIDEYRTHRVNDRYYSVNQEDQIEKFFINLGYSVFNLEDLGFLDQINLFFNATHIAGLNGTSFMNTMFCKEGTNVFLLHGIKDYEFPYRGIIESLKNINLYEIPDKKLHKDAHSVRTRRINSESLMNLMLENYLDKITF